MMKRSHYYIAGLLVALLAATPAFAQTKSGAGIGADVERAVIQHCEIDYRDLRISINDLMRRVNHLLRCNESGKTYNPANSGCDELPKGPAHTWEIDEAAGKAVLQFVDQNGGSTVGQNLKGPQGDPGNSVQCYPAESGSSSSGGSSSSSSSSSSGGSSSSGASSSSGSSSGASSSGASSSGASSSGASSTSSTSSGGFQGCCWEPHMTKDCWQCRSNVKGGATYMHNVCRNISYECR